MSIRAKDLSKQFGEPPVGVLHSLDFEIATGEFVALTGKSGSGKSTLLYIISTLDEPTAGSVAIDGRPVHAMNSKELHAFRNLHVGFVFQFHYLLPELTALENVLLPARKTEQHEHKHAAAIALLDEFDIADKADRLPGQLSGGEQQRVSIARALLMEPRFLFADEPTGNLDSKNGEVVMNIFQRINRERGVTIVMVTHDPDFAAVAHRQIFLKDGRIAAPD